MTALINYYLSQMCKRIDQNTNAFATEIAAKRKGDWERVDYIENVVLKPLNTQINYLARKVETLLGGGHGG